MAAIGKLFKFELGFEFKLDTFAPLRQLSLVIFDLLLVAFNIRVVLELLTQFLCGNFEVFLNFFDFHEGLLKLVLI